MMPFGKLRICFGDKKEKDRKRLREREKEKGTE
jgi:hypothetical protein